MKKKIVFLFIIFLIFIFPNYNPKALMPYEVEAHFKENCSVIELANAKVDGSLEKIECYDNYLDAKNVMMTSDNDDLVIIENGIIIDTKYGIVDYDISYTNIKKGYIDVYDSSTGKQTSGHYIRTAGYYADDAVMLDYDYNSKRVKIKVAGLVGWLDKYSGTSKLYDIVPLNWAKLPQYYNVTETTLYHYFPKDVYPGDGSKHSYAIDLKPDMLDVGQYYSYDGHYFYTSLKTLIQDYKNGNYLNAVNKDNPYYNYYQYVSFRTKSNYTSENIDNYLDNRISDKTSKMINTGSYFIDSQNNYGANAILMMAIGINESGSGRSNIAREKNNLFGLNAIDSNPNLASSKFDSVKDCIDAYGYVWLSYGYLNPTDARFKGANLGDKGEGLNYKYASDPFWGEKAASYYFQIDKMYDFQDRYSYTIAVLNDNYNNVVYAYKNMNGEKIDETYQYKIKNSPVIVLEKIKQDDKEWYKIQSDPNLDENLNYIGSSKSNPKVNYNWNSYAYVDARYFNIVATSIDEELNNEVKPISNEQEQKEEIPISNENEHKQDENTASNENNNEQKEQVIVYKDILNIVTDAGYKIENSFIYNIKLNKSVEELKKELMSKEATEVIVKDNKGNIKTTILATGDKITIKSGPKEEIYDVVVKGDLNGDGLINSADLLKMRQHLLGKQLSASYEKAAYLDFNNINSANLLKLRQYLLGKISIN